MIILYMLLYFYQITFISLPYVINMLLYFLMMDPAKNKLFIQKTENLKQIQEFDVSLYLTFHLPLYPKLNS